MKVQCWLAMISLLIMVSCSPNNYVRSWGEIPDKEEVTVVTSSGREYVFHSWKVGADSSFIGIADEGAYFVSKDSIKAIYVPGATPVSKKVLIGVAGAAAGAAFVVLIIKIADNAHPPVADRLPVPLSWNLNR